MNPLLLILFLFFVLGVLDKIFGGCLGLALGLDRGLSQMGPLAMSMVGFYCIGVTMIVRNMEAITQMAQTLPFDLSVLPGLLLAPDMGGFPMAAELAGSPSLALLSGMLYSSSIGCLISFQLPIALTMIPNDCIPEMMRGLVPGILTIPAGILVGGLLLGIGPAMLLVQLLPVILLCLLLLLGFLFAPGATTHILMLFGKLVRALGLLLFALVMLGLFYPPASLADQALISEALGVVIKITVVVCGANILSDLLMRHAQKALGFCAHKLSVNEISVMGLFLSLTSGVAMLPFFSEMDTRGKILNSAFSVMGAYVFGGQMAFIAGMTTAGNTAVYMAGKLMGGCLAVVLACLFTRRESQKLAASSAL